MRHTLFVLSLLACGSPPEPPPPEPQPTAAEEKSKFSAAMQEHYAVATDARNQLIRGDLAGARVTAARMESLAVPDVPAPWQPHLERVRAATAELADAEDEEAAGQRLAALAKACSDCHAEVGGGPRTDAAAALADATPPETHMKQHLWVADRMWLGLIATNGELFTSSATFLAESELHPLGKEGAKDDELATLERQVHELAAAQGASRDRGEQAVLYGHMITNCARCHSKAGVTPVVTGAP
ncbi:MAG: hypothetical protein EP330_12580 [Deltaproteobacteria bacterium]|nr:MAG: hypothetical protein EP330_12580 [Deltaproteobacteria bacterium]